MKGLPIVTKDHFCPCGCGHKLRRYNGRSEPCCNAQWHEVPTWLRNYIMFPDDSRELWRALIRLHRRLRRAKGQFAFVQRFVPERGHPGISLDEVQRQPPEVRSAICRMIESDSSTLVTVQS